MYNKKGSREEGREGGERREGRENECACERVREFENERSRDALSWIDSSRIWDSPFEGQVRLINASSVSSGHLEIYCNSQWGAVCSDYFNRKAAMTVCIQLGYNAVEAWHASIR